MTPEQETDALLDALGRGEPPRNPGDRAARLLALLRHDVASEAASGAAEEAASGVASDAAEEAAESGQRRSSVSMTPST